MYGSGFTPGFPENGSRPIFIGFAESKILVHFWVGFANMEIGDYYVLSGPKIYRK